MIRINLLAVERERTKKKAGFQFAQKLTVGCSLILVLGALFIGWRYWSLTRQSAEVDREIAQAQEEAGRLHTIIQQVQQFEQRKAQLQQRVELIEQLRRGQNGPVHMLDQISRAMPEMLWLTELKQNSATEVVIDGKCLSLTSLSDFVANLEASGYFKKSIDIVSSTTEPMSQAPGELIRFSIRALFQPPSETAAAPARVGG